MFRSELYFYLCLVDYYNHYILVSKVVSFLPDYILLDMALITYGSLLLTK